MSQQLDPGYVDALLASNGHTAEPPAPPGWAPKIRHRMLTLGELNDLPPLEPAIDGLIDLDSLVLLYGRRGSFKSFVAVDMLASINTGARWQGRGVAQGPVVYVIGEGLGGLSDRFDAWFAAHPFDPPREDLFILPEPVNLLSTVAVAGFIEAVEEIEPRLIVLDTLARCMVGGDENSARDAGVAVTELDRIRRATGAAVVAVHHAGKNTEAGARGSSAFEAAADTVLAVEGTDGIITISCVKQKNHPEPNSITLVARSTAKSVVLEPRRGGETVLGSVARAALEALAVACTGAAADGVSASVWRVAAGIAERSFYRAKSDLIRLEHVAVTPGGRPLHSITAKGTAMLTEETDAL